MSYCYTDKDSFLLSGGPVNNTNTSILHN